MNIENALLCSAITNNERAIILSSELTEKYFTCFEQRQVFNNICNLLKKNEPINTISLISLEKEETKQQIMNFILYIIKETGFINFEQCIRIVKENYNKKILEGHAIDLVKAVKDNNNINEIMDKLYQTYIDISTPVDNTQKKICEYAEIGYKKLFENLNVVKTGIKEIDDKIHGFLGGQLITIAARPRMGKSALALQIANGIGEGCIFYGLEMKAVDNYARMLAKHSGIPVTKIITGNITEYEEEELKKVETKMLSNNLRIVDNVNNIRDIIIDIKNKSIRQNVKCIIIDYLQIIRCSEGFNRDTQIGIITKELKTIAMQYNVPIVILAQLGRDYEKSDRKPILSDLRESGNIENDSDIVMFIHSDDDTNKPVMNVDLIIAKGRNFGTGFIEMVFDKPKFTFKDRISSVNFNNDIY